MTEDVQMDRGVGRTIGLLGGETTLQAKVLNSADAHELLLKGLPVSSVLHLVSTAAFLKDGNALKRAIGVSLAALQRRKAKIAPPRLSVDQGSRCWRVAKVFVHAIDVIGSEEAAGAWMTKPAMGLKNRKPVDLLATYPGMELVEQYLTQIECGVYT
jgi:putative toxin-antitoxin system antitoxin component (TIGR02293 family)